MNESIPLYTTPIATRVQLPQVQAWLLPVYPLILYMGYRLIPGIAPGKVVGILLALGTIAIIDYLGSIYAERGYMDTVVKIESLPGQPKFMWVDANVLDVLYDMLPLSDLNPDVFASLVLSVDNILQMRHDTEIGVQACADHHRLAQRAMVSSMEAMDGLDMVVPMEGELRRRYQQGRKFLHLYLMRQLDYISAACFEQLMDSGLSGPAGLIDTYPWHSYNEYPRETGMGNKTR